MIELPVHNFATWRDAARRILHQNVPPHQVHFCDARNGQSLLALDAEPHPSASGQTRKVPREFMEMAVLASCFRDPTRWNLLYTVLWRLTHDEPHLLNDHSDPELRRLHLMEKAVRRDRHKMRAFVRFREAAAQTYIAWYKPEHHIVRLNADFFVRRFGSMRWAILTPDESVYWDCEQLQFGPGLPRESAPAEDQVEDLWLTYYGSIFNPARIKLAAMQKEMPAIHWDTLPEAKLIAPLLHQAGERVAGMVKEQPGSARDYLPQKQAQEAATLPVLAAAARHCEGCELHEAATQVVFGEGPTKARIMLVGEQPGDEEDQCGKPFVGPAGQLLNQALLDAGIERQNVYITNAVKHFRFELGAPVPERGKHRLHKRPSGRHIASCRPWLEAEIQQVQPESIVCLGSTAAQSLIGRDVRIHEDRSRWMSSLWANRLLITTHPSALLRMTPDRFPESYALFVQDLQMLHQPLSKPIA